MAFVVASTPATVAFLGVSAAPVVGLKNWVSLKVTSMNKSFGVKSSLNKVTCFKITVKTPSAEETFKADGNIYILDATKSAGLDFPYSCRADVCSLCTRKIASGGVDQSDGSFLDDDQIAAGYVLTCVTYPTSDLSSHVEEELN